MSAMEDSLRQHLAQFDPTPSDEQIEALGISDFPGDVAGSQAAQGWRVEDQGAADWALRRIAEAEAKQNAAMALAQQQIAQVNAWLEKELAKSQRTVDYFTGRLTDYHRQVLEQDPKAKTVALPHGKLTARQSPDRVEVAEEAVETLPESFKRIKVEPDKKALLQHIKQTGELPEGVTLIPGEIRFSVKTGGDE